MAGAGEEPGFEILAAKARHGRALRRGGVVGKICIEVCTYVLIAIAKKRLHLHNSLHAALQILTLTMVETTPINQLLTPPEPDKHSEFEPQQRHEQSLVARQCTCLKGVNANAGL